MYGRYPGKQAMALAALWLGFAAPAGALIEIVDETSVNLEWAAASGPVDAYTVWTSRNGGAFQRSHLVIAPKRQVTLSGDYGDRFILRVSAFAFDDTDLPSQDGPLSEPSDEIRFVQSAPPPAGAPPPLPPPDPEPEPTPPPPDPEPEPTPPSPARVADG